MTPTSLVRPFRLEDAAGVAAVQVGNYRVDYAPLFPPGFWDGVTVEEQTGDWAAWCVEYPRDVLLVAAGAEGLLGYVLARAADYHGAQAEVMALHVRPDARGRGVGAALLGAALAELAGRGVTSVGLSTLEGNAARAWYEALGGERVDTRVDHFGDWQVREAVFVWRNLGALRARLARGVSRSG